jgi:hypothetical protein
MDSLNTPVLLNIFNRPLQTLEVFNVIKLVKPKKLYIAADGPRLNYPDDFINCERARSIIKLVDWECELKLLFRKENLGCKSAIISAIDWFFLNEEHGIILEDDCFCNLSFFEFCDEMLIKFSSNESIMGITGNNFISEISKSNYSYYFSNYPLIWGWATWRRTWMKYHEFSNINNSVEMDIMLNNRRLRPAVVRYWKLIHYQILNGLISTWDYHLVFMLMKENGLFVVPSKNLVKNIGFSKDALNTKNTNSDLANLENKQLNWPLNHPIDIKTDSDLDKILEDKYYSISQINYLIKQIIIKYKK